MNPRERVITFFEPGLKRQVKAGKFCRADIGGTVLWVYVNNVSLRFDLMEELDAWGVAPCVMWTMEEMGISTIHYVSTEEGATYIADIETVRQKGILRSYGRRGAHYHLRRKHWHRAHGQLSYPWVNAELELEWLEPEVIHA